MKKLTFVFLGFILTLSAYTQNPFAVFYSELGERFTIYIDGNAQHQYPESNVKILDIQGTSHNVRIVFENGFIDEVNKPLVLENGMESTFYIHKKSGRYDLSPKNQIPLSQASRVANAKAQTVVPYRGTTQNTNTNTNVSMNTTSTTSGSGSDGGGTVNVNVNISSGGNDASGNVSVSSTGTGTKDSKASDSYGAGQGSGQGKAHDKGHDKGHGKTDKPKYNKGKHGAHSSAAGGAKDNSSTSSAVAGGAKDNTSSSSAAASTGSNQSGSVSVSVNAGSSNQSSSVGVSVNAGQSGQASSGGKSESSVDHGNHVTGKPNPNANNNNAGAKPMGGNLVHGNKIGVKNQTTNQSVVPGYNGKINCNNPMTAESFATAKKNIDSKNFSQAKLMVAKQIADANCMLVSQIKELIQSFDFEDARLEFAKYAYKKSCDIDNYYQVNEAFQFDASISKLDEYIRTGK